MIVEVYFPGTPAVPGTPARYLELNGPSWSSGSVSIPLTPEDGGYKFQIPASVVGVFVGLSNLDYQERVDAQPELDAYAATGSYTVTVTYQ